MWNFPPPYTNFLGHVTYFFSRKEIGMARTKYDTETKQRIVEESRKPKADLETITKQWGITKKDIYNWRSYLGNGNGKNGHTKAPKKAKARPTRRYTSVDRAKVVELERKLGEAYHRIHVLEQFILEKELGIPSK
jgi:transposase-like protein